MTNVLNSIVSGQSIKPSTQKTSSPSFTFTTQGKVKPLRDKATLLPSKIFGSPVEYLKDLKQDVVNVGRAATGHANDHELGRINDLAMKVGSLALAAYLCCKVPAHQGKLKKAMEFVGFGTFFGGMALWPKLTIQAPLKMRTGVDIHQKYQDSQGRKKMLHQDPQYDLTDLYPQEDLDKFAKKLKVNENLPDRNRFVKQRAKKVAVQGNTLWMMTAGFATPLLSAIGCNLLEKPIDKALSVYDLKSTQKAFDRLGKTGKVGGISGYIYSLKQKKTAKALEKFFAENADKVVADDSDLKKLCRILYDENSQYLYDKVKNQIKENATEGVGYLDKLDEKTIREVIAKEFRDKSANLEAFKDVDMDEFLEQFFKANMSKINEHAGDPTGILDICEDALRSMDLGEDLADVLDKNKDHTIATMLKAKMKVEATYGKLKGQIEDLNKFLSEYVPKYNVIDRYKMVRVGGDGISESVIARAWNNVERTIIKEIGFTDDELKKISKGLTQESSTNKDKIHDTLNNKLTELAKGDKDKYNRVISKISKQIEKFEEKLSPEFCSSVEKQVKDLSDATKDKVTGDLAQHLSTGAGTSEAFVRYDLKNQINGAKSSFYRLLETMDFYKRAETEEFKASAKELIAQMAQIKYEKVDENTKERTIEIIKKFQNADEVPDELVKSYIKLAKKILMETTDTCVIEKFDMPLFKGIIEEGKKIQKWDYNIVMNMLYAGNAGETLDTPEIVKQGFQDYLAAVKQMLTKKENDKLVDGVIMSIGKGKAPNLFNPVIADYGDALGFDRLVDNKEIGKQFKQYFKDAADKAYNTNKWIKIFGTALGVLTVGTVAATFFIGRKTKMEEQVEQELKLNG